jgi:hypothetical protein
MVTEVVSFGTITPAGSANRKPGASENAAAQSQDQQKPVEATAFESSLASQEQKAAAEREQKEREKDRQAPQLDSLALDSTRLSILQDAASKRFVYRGLNVVTKEVERQYPSESELRRSALLRELRGSFIDELS